MSELFLDFETRSRVDLKKAGAYRYAEDPSTEILCASYAFDDGPVQLYRPGDGPTATSWFRALDDPHGPFVVAHNAEFERLILKHKLGLDLPAGRFRCTAAQAARMSLPRSLDAAGQVLQLAHLKDAAAGHRLIGKLSKPRRGGEFWERETAEEDFDDMEEYNGGDVETMRDLRRLLPQLTDREQAIWELTVRMNERGLSIDLEAAHRMEMLAQREMTKLAARWEELVGVKAGSPKAAKALGMKSLSKVAVRHALKRTDLAPKVREALLIRQRLARASVKKLAAFFARTNLDGVLRGTMIYGGAERTTRWSAGGVQPHNFPRGLAGATELAFELLAVDGLELVYDDILRTLGDMLKGLLVGPFLIGDYGQIEARTLAVLAGQDDLVYAFEHGVEVYCRMAEDIYGHPVTKDDYDEKLHIAKRQLGKIAVLGCGYQLGAKKLAEQMDRDFDVQLDPLTAQTIVTKYRERYPDISRFWQRLENFWRQAVRNNQHLHFGLAELQAGVQTFNGRRFAFLSMPNGERMWYYQPEADRPFRHKTGFKNADGSDEYETRVQGAYFGRDLLTHKWQMTSTYGGKLTENTVQKTAREILADAMLRLDKAGFPLVLSVHDEAVSKGTPEELGEFKRIMEERPEWLRHIPLTVDAFAAKRYHK